ncbi:MAG: putative membrane protein [Sphingobacteriales bacterium]|jgi:putative membrane protein
MNIKNILFVIMAILLTIVVMQNQESVSLLVLVWEIEIPKIILLPIFLVLGYISGYLTGRLRKNSSKPIRPKEETKDNF